MGASDQVCSHWPLGERCFHVTESLFGTRQQRIDPLGLVGREIGAIGLQQVSTVEPLGDSI